MPLRMSRAETSVNNVDAVLRAGHVHAFPEAGHGRGRNGDTALLLMLHPVGGGSAVVHFAQLVGHAGVKQDAFRRGGFTCVNVGRDTDIAVAANRCFASHDGSLMIKGKLLPTVQMALV